MEEDPSRTSDEEEENETVGAVSKIVVTAPLQEMGSEDMDSLQPPSNPELLSAATFDSAEQHSWEPSSIQELPLAEPTSNLEVSLSEPPSNVEIPLVEPPSNLEGPLAEPPRNLEGLLPEPPSNLEGPLAELPSNLEGLLPDQPIDLEVPLVEPQSSLETPFSVPPSIPDIPAARALLDQEVVSTETDDITGINRFSSEVFRESSNMLPFDERVISETSITNEDDDYNRGAESENEDDVEEAVQSDLVVLDPDHPLMQEFQSKLKEHLLKEIDKAQLKRRAVVNELNRKKGNREDLGVRLYGTQQELARQQASLEQLRDKHTAVAEKRRNQEGCLSKLRDTYKQYQAQTAEEKNKNSELQTEVENLSTRLFYMINAKDDIKSDIAVMKRAAEKAETEVIEAEMSKQRQDLHVNRLTEKVEELQDTIAMYEAQQKAQAEETISAKQSLNEAKDEIEAIELEKKRLFQQWNSSLIGMKRRDEAHAAMQEALTMAKQQIKSLETEISGYKRSIQKEEMRNETLTMVLNKVEMNKYQTKKQIKLCVTKQDALKQRYGTYSRTLQETKDAFNDAVMEKSSKQEEIVGLQKMIEKVHAEKEDLEDKIMKDVQLQLSASKARSYSVKITEKLRVEKKRLEAELSIIENEMARGSLQQTESQSRLRSLHVQREELEHQIRCNTSLIGQAEHDAAKRNAVIERKQTNIDQIKKKIEQVLSIGSGEELGPLEVQINSLNKQIEAASQGITDLQQFWLRQQHELVHVTKQRDQQSEAVNKLKKQHTILQQKKLRIEGEIQEQVQEQLQIDKSMRHMQIALTKLNSLLNQEKGIQENLEQGNILTENEFVQELKELELESIQMQQKLDGMKEEKERLLNSLVEAERQIMLWEKKTQLAKETRAAVDSEVGQGEMREMRAEIHRMQVRHNQLMKQQERMVRDTVAAVSRRDTIVTRGEAQSQLDHKTPTKGKFRRRLGDVKRKIAQTQKDAAACDNDLRHLHKDQGELGKNLETKQSLVQDLQGAVDTLERDIERLSDMKERNFMELISQQSKAKHLQSLKDGKYTLLCKSSEAIEAEMLKQQERYFMLITILDRLIDEYPQAQPALRRISVIHCLDDDD